MEELAYQDSGAGIGRADNSRADLGSLRNQLEAAAERAHMAAGRVEDIADRLLGAIPRNVTQGVSRVGGDVPQPPRSFAQLLDDLQTGLVLLEANLNRL